MNEAIRTRNHWKTVAMVLVAVLVLLVVALVSMLQPPAPTGVGGRAVPPAAHATSPGGSGITKDPYIDHHAAVVAAHQQRAPR